MHKPLAEPLPPPGVLHVDDDGFVWVASADPSVLVECERNPIQMDDGSVVRPRMVRLRPGYILEDVVGDSAPSGPLACHSDHYRRSMKVAQLLEYRQANALLKRHMSSPAGGGDEQRVEGVAAPVGLDTSTGKSQPGSPESGPLTTWAAVARAVGVSVDTMSRRRKEWNDTRAHPYYIDVAAARAWYRHGNAGGAGLPPAALARKARPRIATGKLGAGGTTLADLLAAKGVATTAVRDAKVAPLGKRKVR